MILFFPIVFLGAFTQTEYSFRPSLDLTISNDGRIEALIDSNDQSWMTVYRQFIELDSDTGELMLAFDVASSEYPSKTAMENDAHIMTTTLASGASSWSQPLNATENDEGYIHSNMVLWYDEMQKQMVMVYQSSRTNKSESDGFDVHLTLVRKESGEEEWSSEQTFLDEIDSPHIRYQFIDSATKNTDGYAENLLIPVHEQAASDTDDNYDYLDNYQAVVTIDRGLSEDADLDIALMEYHLGASCGYYQASIIRVPSETSSVGSQLVAFLRDSQGYWLYRSTSDDDGVSWTDAYVTSIPNPDQTAQAIYLHSDLVMLIYNPSQSMTTEPSPGDRYANSHHLAVGLSADYGLTWQFSRMLEYAYDGMFNYPVGLQDPECNNVYLTYSVMTDMTNGCSLLDECDEVSQGTKSYIKFTVINEFWVMNEFDYQYDVDNCVWQLPESSSILSTSTLDIEVNSTTLDLIIALCVIAGIILAFNLTMCIVSYCKKDGYENLEGSQQTNDPKNYDTTEAK